MMDAAVGKQFHLFTILHICEEVGPYLQSTLVFIEFGMMASFVGSGVKCKKNLTN